MEKDNHAATKVLMDTLILGFTSPQKEISLTNNKANNEGDVSMETFIHKTDALKTAQPCETENLINVLVDYVSVDFNQSTNIKQPRGAARETQKTQVGQTWKRLARDRTFSTPASFAVSIAVGSKRMYKEIVSDKDEIFVERCCNSTKHGRLVEDNHDSNFPTAEVDKQPRRAQ